MTHRRRQKLLGRLVSQLITDLTVFILFDDGSLELFFQGTTAERTCAYYKIDMDRLFKLFVREFSRRTAARGSLNSQAKFIASMNDALQFYGFQYNLQEELYNRGPSWDYVAMKKNNADAEHLVKWDSQSLVRFASREIYVATIIRIVLGLAIVDVAQLVLDFLL